MPVSEILFALLLSLLSMGGLVGRAWSAEAIAMDVGRQLFVDELLIDQTDLQRTFHAAQMREEPVLKPETPLERNASRGPHALPVAAPFCDGVWFDPAAGLFKMWYHAGWFDAVAFATSRDGIHWERPSLDVTAGTNRVLPPREQDGCLLKRDAASIWRDGTPERPEERWKMFVFSRLTGRPESESRGELFSSPDGIHWETLGPVGFWHGDNTSLFKDPFRRQWVLSVRETGPSPWNPKRGIRARFIHTAREFDKLRERPGRQRAPLWLNLDGRDRPDPELGYKPELYHFTATPYESLMLGVFGIFYGPPNEVCAQEERPKIIDLQLGFSRDGFVYDRPQRQAFLRCSRQPGTWNFGYLHPATGVCLVVGDQLHFYFGAWSGVGEGGRKHMYAGGSTGLATLRRDGFASMDAGAQGGTLTTTPVVFQGRFPFVNVAADRGELRVEMLDAAGRVIPPFSREHSMPIHADGTRLPLTWQGVTDLGALVGKPVRFRFLLTQGALYSFWVSAKEDGCSGGYLAAGGPGLPGSMDQR